MIWLAHERTWMDGKVDEVQKRLRGMEGKEPVFTKAAEDVFAEGRKQVAQALKPKK